MKIIQYVANVLVVNITVHSLYTMQIGGSGNHSILW